MPNSNDESELQSRAEYSVSLAAHVTLSDRVSAARVPGYPGLWIVDITGPDGGTDESETSYVIADSDRVAYPVPASNSAEVNCLAIIEYLAGTTGDYDESDLEQ